MTRSDLPPGVLVRPGCRTCNDHGIIPLYAPDGTLDDSEPCPDECTAGVRVTRLRMGATSSDPQHPEVT